MKNKNDKKTVLHVISTLRHGGTERYLINLLKETSDSYNNVVLYYYGDNTWRNEFSSKSVKFYKCDCKKRFKNLRRIFKILKIIKKERVNIVYSYTYYNSIFVLLAACLAGIKKRIVHAHRIGWDTEILRIKVFFSKLLISMLATDKLACSDVAGRSLFIGGNYRVIKNGFCVNSYRYNDENRRALRERLGINDDCILLGGIGRIDRNKNQRFMIDVLGKLLKRKVKSKLLLVGGLYHNDEYEVLKEFCKKNELVDHVIFIDEVDNVNDYYSAIDVLLMTSFKESFSFVVVEGQANGVPVLASETISPDIIYNKNARIIKLEANVNTWADAVISIYGKRTDPDDQLFEYSCSSMVKSVIEVYEQVPSKNERLGVSK